jgi:hypothetical protein
MFPNYADNIEWGLLHNNTSKNVHICVRNSVLYVLQFVTVTAERRVSGLILIYKQQFTTAVRSDCPPPVRIITCSVSVLTVWCYRRCRCMPDDVACSLGARQEV